MQNTFNEDNSTSDLSDIKLTFTHREPFKEINNNQKPIYQSEEKNIQSFSKSSHNDKNKVLLDLKTKGNNQNFDLCKLEFTF